MVGSYDSLDERNRVSVYLDSGVVCAEWRGLSFCRFDCGVDARSMGYRDLTDGTWIWPEGLSHYVSEHNVVLPAEFLDYMKKRNWKFSDDLDVTVNQRNYDFEYWTEIT